MLGIIADVHANLPALEAVLGEMESRGVSDVLCAGDLVGYGPDPCEVIDVLRDWNVASIAGNHDRAAAGGETSGFGYLAAVAIEWTRGRLSPAEKGFLGSLPESICRSGMAVFHGHPSDPDRYVFPGELADESAEILELAGADVVVLGHTHVPASTKTSRGIVVNPGAVGQPRDGDPRAAYALFDPDKGDAEIKRVSYPVKQVQRDMEEAGLPERLARRLAVGN